MITTVKRQIEQEQIVDIICDICSCSCKFELSFEYASLNANWGYESKWDGYFTRAHICEKCMEKHIAPLLCQSFLFEDLPIEVQP
jgi:hypothetical protein